MQSLMAVKSFLHVKLILVEMEELKLSRSEVDGSIQGTVISDFELHIRNALKSIVTEYQQAKTENFKGHPMGQILRSKIKEVLIKETGLNSDTYYVAGSVGISRWAEIPWLCVFLKDLTTSATRGYYIVYLFSADGSGLYISLNQGWTYFKDKYGTKIGREKIQKTASIVRDKLNTVPHNMNLLNIDLKGEGNLAKGYELGHICGRYYDIDNLPGAEEIINDLQGLLLTYREVVGLIGKRSIEQFNDYILLHEDGLYPEDEISEEEYQLAVQKSVGSKNPQDIYEEEKKKNRPEPIVNKGGRKQWIRNAAKASKALMLSNYTCEIDSTHQTFIPKSTNMPYVESHHLIPMGKQGEFQYGLDRLANLISLCPLCHRLIHLGTDADKEKLLRKLYDQRKERLENIGIEINFSELKRVYGISLKGGER
jgi:5-methylcytosine-specific restriction enzyme A